MQRTASEGKSFIYDEQFNAFMSLIRTDKTNKLTNVEVKQVTYLCEFFKEKKDTWANLSLLAIYILAKNENPKLNKTITDRISTGKIFDFFWNRREPFEDNAESFLRLGLSSFIKHHVDAFGPSSLHKYEYPTDSMSILVIKSFFVLAYLTTKHANIKKVIETIFNKLFKGNLYLFIASINSDMINICFAQNSFPIPVVTQLTINHYYPALAPQLKNRFIAGVAEFKIIHATAPVSTVSLFNAKNANVRKEACSPDEYKAIHPGYVYSESR